MDFASALQDVKMTVDKELRDFFLKKRGEAQKIHPQTLPLVDAMSDFTLRGGKRMRAFLVWVGHQCVIPAHARLASKRAGIQSTKNWIPYRHGDDKLLYAMMGIELFQSFALIHDDIIDEDTMRRGSPTVHEHFMSEVLGPKSNVKNAVRFGESMAILAGDLALVWADEMMNNIQYPISNDQSKRQKKLSIGPLMLYQKMKEEVILGQSLDVLAAAGLPSADRTTINRYKTAWYTVIRPLQIGAVLAGGDEKIIEAFVPYGLVVGEGYQLRDDFLDGEISEETLRTQSAKYEHQATQAVHAIQAPIGVASLLADFARFALNREK